MTTAMTLDSVPDVGTLLIQDGHQYRCVSHAPAVSAAGSPFVLVSWAGQCADCGERFEATSAGKVIGSLSRRCEAHRRTGIKARPWRGDVPDPVRVAAQALVDASHDVPPDQLRLGDLEAALDAPEANLRYAGGAYDRRDVWEREASRIWVENEARAETAHSDLAPVSARARPRVGSADSCDVCGRTHPQIPCLRCSS